MNKKELAKYFDHTFLKPYATNADLEKLCREAKEIGACMVAINTTWTKFCKAQLQGSDVHVGAAISFPLGQAGLASKIAETKIAIGDGADEIDYVIDIGQAKMHNWDYIKEEMEAIVSICREKNVISKVIFENCYLTKEEIKQVAIIAKEVKPDFIKTSTGFGTSGATVEDVKLMAETVEEQVKVKAAGGIRDWPTCKAMIEAGASRIGTSSSLTILEQFKENKMKPLFVKPIPNATIWGSNHISKARHVNQNYGTWWEISAHPYCTNEITNLDTPITLQEIIDKNPDDILGPGLSQKDILRLAYLDTQDNLSIQVHPNQDYAKKYENDNGKHESWYIVDAAKGACLCAGTKTTDANIIKKAVQDGTLEDYIQYIPVKKGDFVVIPTGMLHALGKDILAIEVSTNSNVTYRFYDYNRKDANGNTRPLHLEKSFDVVDFTLQPTYVPAKEVTHVLADTPYYRVEEIYATEDTTIQVKDSYFILSNMGEDTTLTWEKETLPIKKYDSVWIPYSAKEITLSKGAHVLYSQPKKG